VQLSSQPGQVTAKRLTGTWQKFIVASSVWKCLWGAGCQHFPDKVSSALSVLPVRTALVPAHTHISFFFSLFPAPFCDAGQSCRGVSGCHGTGFPAAAGADCPPEEGDGPADTAVCRSAGGRATRDPAQQTASTVSR